MGTRDKYDAGTFSWVELATSDAAAAKAFYREVFGWAYEDRDVDGGATYAVARLQDRSVAGLMQSEQPPRWNSYVSVDSADEAARTAAQAGGRATEPFDVMDAGRMTVVTDPTGASLRLWEARRHPGAGIVNTAGALTWNDLVTSDVARAAEFYRALLGWEVAPVEGAPGNRVVIRNGGRMNGGMAEPPRGAGGTAPHWLPYFGVEDADAAAAKVGELGGRVVAPPMDVPAGRFALCADPQGALFAVFTGEYDD